MKEVDQVRDLPVSGCVNNFEKDCENSDILMKEDHVHDLPLSGCVSNTEKNCEKSDTSM